ncbi:unnamed protein product, partial [Durusdinium trenchii]
MRLPTEDPDEGQARTTKRGSEQAPALSPNARAMDKTQQIPISCISFFAILAAASAMYCLYFKPWMSINADLQVSPYLNFQEKQMQCHKGCRQHDVANSHCLQQCLPQKQKCIDSQCDMDSESFEFAACALKCHASECEAKCSSSGQRASQCHLSCTPDLRTLPEDPACVKECEAKHDASCMAGCAELTKQCLDSECIGRSHQEYAHCQSRCELKSCGSSCQEAHKSFDECSARCYPQSPSGKEAMFVPPSVRAASMAFVRISDCKKMRRVYDDRHFKCLHICGPKIAACMQSTCPNAVPESELQKSCMESC